jgi:hypothetical protein
MTIVFGDFKSIHPGDARYNAVTGDFIESSDPLDRHIASKPSDFAESFQPDYTRVGRVRGSQLTTVKPTDCSPTCTALISPM